MGKGPTGVFLLVNVGSISQKASTSGVVSRVDVVIQGVGRRSPGAGLCLRDMLPIGSYCNVFGKRASH